MKKKPTYPNPDGNANEETPPAKKGGKKSPKVLPKSNPFGGKPK